MHLRPLLRVSAEEPEGRGFARAIADVAVVRDPMIAVGRLRVWSLLSMLCVVGCKNEVHATAQCLGNGSVTENYEGYAFSIQHGPALDVGGNCKVFLTNCTVTAPIGIRATENAVVTIRGGKMVGREQLVLATGKARIVFENVETAGPVSVTGSANVSGLKQ